MIAALVATARLARRYALACPLLFLVPALVEMAQHVAEIAAGFYDSVAAMKAAERDGARMVLGHAKVIALFVAGYWTARFMTTGDAAQAARIDRRTLATFAPVMAWGLFWLVLAQDVPPLAGAAGLAERPVTLALLGVSLGMMFFEPLLASWKVAAALGDVRTGFGRSIRVTAPHYGFALALTLLVQLPLLALHYALAIAALGRPALTWPLMIADALLVGVIAAVGGAANVVIAQRASAVGEPAAAASAPQPVLPTATPPPPRSFR